MKSISERLESQIRFLIEIDQIKHIFRKTKLFNKSRFENDAEHAWLKRLTNLKEEELPCET